MQDEADRQPQPRCGGCGGELVEQDGSSVLRLVGLLLIVLVLPLCLLSELVRAGLRYACATAVIVLCLMLMPRRLCWRCVSCGARFRRRLPPRGFERNSGRADQNSDAAPLSSGPGADGG